MIPRIRNYIPKTFRFSPLITLGCIILAGLMLTASRWQWERYKYKVALLETYKSHSKTVALPFPLEGKRKEDFAKILHRKVRVSGTYDLSQQIIVTNRKHRTGPGHWLLAPLRLEGSNQYVMVSRGFIPFKDRSPDEWEKYDVPGKVQIAAVVTESVPHRVLIAPKSATASGEWVSKWLYPDIEKISKQLSYPLITAVFLKKLGPPLTGGTFPAEAVSLRVPPSTHFGYTIEWFLLALAVLIIGFILQAFPRNWQRKTTRSISTENPSKTAQSINS